MTGESTIDENGWRHWTIQRPDPERLYVHDDETRDGVMYHRISVWHDIKRADGPPDYVQLTRMDLLRG